MVTTPTLAITWEKLPDDFVLDDDPVGNLNQPLLAAALSESLELSGKLPANALTTTNYGICSTLALCHSGFFASILRVRKTPIALTGSWL